MDAASVLESIDDIALNAEEAERMCSTVRTLADDLSEQISDDDQTGTWLNKYQIMQIEKLRFCTLEIARKLNELRTEIAEPEAGK